MKLLEEATQKLEEATKALKDQAASILQQQAQLRQQLDLRANVGEVLTTLSGVVQGTRHSHVERKVALRTVASVLVTDTTQGQIVSQEKQIQVLRKTHSALFEQWRAIDSAIRKVKEHWPTSSHRFSTLASRVDKVAVALAALGPDPGTLTKDVPAVAILLSGTREVWEGNSMANSSLRDILKNHLSGNDDSIIDGLDGKIQEVKSNTNDVLGLFSLSDLEIDTAWRTRQLELFSSLNTLNEQVLLNPRQSQQTIQSFIASKAWKDFEDKDQLVLADAAKYLGVDNASTQWKAVVVNTTLTDVETATVPLTLKAIQQVTDPAEKEHLTRLQGRISELIKSYAARVSSTAPDYVLDVKVASQLATDVIAKLKKAAADGTADGERVKLVGEVVESSGKIGAVVRVLVILDDGIFAKLRSRSEALKTSIEASNAATIPYLLAFRTLAEPELRAELPKLLVAGGKPSDVIPLVTDSSPLVRDAAIDALVSAGDIDTLLSLLATAEPALQGSILNYLTLSENAPIDMLAGFVVNQTLSVSVRHASLEAIVKLGLAGQADKDAKGLFTKEGGEKYAAALKSVGDLVSSTSAASSDESWVFEQALDGMSRLLAPASTDAEATK